MKPNREWMLKEWKASGAGINIQTTTICFSEVVRYIIATLELCGDYDTWQQTLQFKFFKISPLACKPRNDFGFRQSPVARLAFIILFPEFPSGVRCSDILRKDARMLV